MVTSNAHESNRRKDRGGSPFTEAGNAEFWYKFAEESDLRLIVQTISSLVEVGDLSNAEVLLYSAILVK
jgi:hypothetical protein